MYVSVIYRVINQMECVIHFLVVAPQVREYLFNT